MKIFPLLSLGLQSDSLWAWASTKSGITGKWIFQFFFKAALVEDVYISLQSYFDSDAGEDRAEMVINLDKILYVLVKDPPFTVTII